MTPTLQQALAAVQQLPSLSGNTRTVLSQLNAPKPDIPALAQSIARDQGLAARLLRVANSPFFGLSNQVQTMHEAVLVLGLSNLRMVVTAALVTAQKFPGLTLDADVQRLYRHSIAVAICAGAIAQAGQQNQNLLFLAGILHEVGELFLKASYAPLYAEVQQLLQDDALLACEAERRVFGFDHAAIGAALCHHWRLPPAIAHAIAHHHDLEQRARTGPAHALDAYAEIVHLADAVALGLNLEADPRATVPPVSDRAWQRWMGPREQLAVDFAAAQSLYHELVQLVDGGA